jgi:EmrB/QacA subfamily drug resistance transporter
MTPSIPRSRLVLTVGGLLLVLLLAALDSTIVATAMPRIAAELRGFNRYSWVTVAYLLSSTVGVPVVGKLADQYGRRPFLVGGALIFLAGSLLCALAGSLEQLVAFRLVQGVGGGTLTAAVFAAVPRLFSPAARARLIGLFTGTYGLASIIGPLLGGLITDLSGWRGVFWINLPIGLVALGVLLAAYPAEPPRGARRSVDYAGATALIGAMTPLLLALLLGGHDLPWRSPSMAGLLAAGASLMAVFVLIERRAPEPIVPLRALATRTLGVPVLGSALMAAGLLATLLFTPLFIQGVSGQTATQSGGVLVPMTTAWVLASVVAGQLIARVGQARPAGVIGMAVAAGGLWLMAGMGPGTEYAVVARNLVIVGLGLGAALAAFVVAAQNAVPVDQSGVATALSTFARAIGGTLASAGLGGLLTAGVASATSSAADPRALSSALDQTFAVSGAVVALGAAAAVLLRELPLRARASLSQMRGQL